MCYLCAFLILLFFFHLDIEFKTSILDVLHNAAHKDFTERKIMVRGSIVEVDGEPFKNWYVYSILIKIVCKLHPSFLLIFYWNIFFLVLVDSFKLVYVTNFILWLNVYSCFF